MIIWMGRSFANDFVPYFCWLSEIFLGIFCIPLNPFLFVFVFVFVFVSYPCLTIEPLGPTDSVQAAAKTVGDDIRCQASRHLAHLLV